MGIGLRICAEVVSTLLRTLLVFMLAKVKGHPHMMRRHTRMGNNSAFCSVFGCNLPSLRNSMIHDDV